MNEGSADVEDFRVPVFAADPVICTAAFATGPDFPAGVLFAGAFFAGALFVRTFFAGPFFADASFAGASFAGAFLVARVGALLAGAFFATGALVAFFFTAFFFTAVLSATAFFATAFFAAAFFGWVFVFATAVFFAALAFLGASLVAVDLDFGADPAPVDGSLLALLLEGDAFFFAAMIPAVLSTSVKSSGEHYQIISKTQAPEGGRSRRDANGMMGASDGLRL